METEYARYIKFGLWSAVCLALLGSLNGVAYAFSTVDAQQMLGPLPWAWIKAGAVDIGFLALAAGIQYRRRRGASTAWLWASAFFFLTISSYANLIFGKMHQVELELGYWAEVRAVPLAAFLPVMVLVLVEIATSYQAQAIAKGQTGEESRGQGKLENQQLPDIANCDEIDVGILRALASDPDATQAEIGQVVGRSRGTISRRLQGMAERGLVKRTEDGYVVAVEVR